MLFVAWHAGVQSAASSAAEHTTTQRSARQPAARTWCHCESATACPAIAHASRLSPGSSTRTSFIATSSSHAPRRNARNASRAPDTSSANVQRPLTSWPSR